MDALQALVDWLYKVEPQLAEDQPVHGDLDLVMNLMDAHKVRGEIWAVWRAKPSGPPSLCAFCSCCPPRASLERKAERACVSACRRGGSLLCVFKQTAAGILHQSQRTDQTWFDSDVPMCKLHFEVPSHFLFICLN